MKRSMGIGCNDESERNAGCMHAVKAVNAILRYREMIPVLLEWMR